MVFVDHVYTVESGARAWQPIEAHDLFDLVESRIGLIALVEFQPAAAPQFVNRVAVVLVANQPGAQARIEARQFQNVDQPDHRQTLRLSKPASVRQVNHRPPCTAARHPQPVPAVLPIQTSAPRDRQAVTPRAESAPL